MEAKTNFRYDYTKTMMMKMFMSKPDGKGGSIVDIDFSKALEIIKNVDNITQGIPKIIYLVGWQNNGHDDKYPDIFEVNKALKRDEDETSYDSLMWLIKEAKKYNTIVSFHVNFNDVYEDAPSFKKYYDNNALIRKKNGKAHAIEKYNGKKCYKACFKKIWESGIWQENINRFLELFPVESLGTLHVDNFQCYKNYAPDVSIDEMSEYRDKMIDYLRQKNIDITTEFTCREDEKLPNVTLFGTPRDHHKDSPIRILGKIPAVWWLTYISNKELIDIVPNVLCGGLLRNGIRNDKRAGFIYGNIHGEECFRYIKDGGDVWHKKFLHDFATVQVPFNYLSRFKRILINGKKGSYVSVHEGNVKSYQKGQRIYVGDRIIKDGDNLCMPLNHLTDTFICYSKQGDSREWNLGIDKTFDVDIYEIKYNNTVFVRKDKVNSGKIKINLSAGQAFIIKFNNEGNHDNFTA